MNLSDFDYLLPEGHIAKYPLAERTQSRLLRLNRKTGELQHDHFYQLADWLEAGDLLVFNNSRVIPARLYGKKSTGGKIEVLVERLLDERRVLAHVRASRSPLPGHRLLLEDQVEAEVIARHQDLFELEFLSPKPVLEILEAIGHIPLPVYIPRADEAMDRERYQTVYAKDKGSVAAPTAGLHFDDALIEQLTRKGIRSTFVTLHVGAGTFQPVRCENILEHKMHAEWVSVPLSVCEAVKEAREKKKRVIAVGTTTVRGLESAALLGILKPYQGETDIFIYPGFSFRVVDAMITNFHLPKSTLLMLVSAFAGQEAISRAYREAIQAGYRFYSYGDAMFIG